MCALLSGSICFCKFCFIRCFCVLPWYNGRHPSNYLNLRSLVSRRMITWKRHLIYFSWVQRLCIAALGKQNKNFLSLWRKLQIQIADHKKRSPICSKLIHYRGVEALWESLKPEYLAIKVSESYYSLFITCYPTRYNIGQNPTCNHQVHFFSPTCLIASLEYKTHEDRSLPYETDLYNILY